MTRTLYQRVIGDHLRSTPRGGERPRRGALEIDRDVARARQHLPSTGRSTAFRMPRPY